MKKAKNNSSILIEVVRIVYYSNNMFKDTDGNDLFY